MCCTVAQSLYNSGQEEIERIGGQAHSMEIKPVEIDLWVLECLADPGPGELFVPSGVVISPESCENFFSLLGSEELCSCGVVVDKEVRSDGHDGS